MNQEIDKELPQFLSRSKRTSEHYKSDLRNFRSCEDIIHEMVIENRSSTYMVPANISSTTSDDEVEIHTFFLRNTRGIVIKQLGLARDEKVKLQSFEQDNTSKHQLPSNICENVYIKIENNVQRSTSRNMFWKKAKRRDTGLYMNGASLYGRKQPEP